MGTMDSSGVCGRSRFAERGGGPLHAGARYGIALALAISLGLPGALAAEGGEPSLPRLPASLWFNIMNRRYPGFVRIDWTALGGLAPVRAVVEAGTPSVLGEVPVVGPAAAFLAAVPAVDAESLTQLWAAQKQAAGQASELMWVKVATPWDSLRSRLLEAGWWEAPGAEGVLSAPMSRRARERLQRLRDHPEEGHGRTAEKYARAISGSQWRLTKCKGGWLMVAPPGAEPPWQDELLKPSQRWARKLEYPWHDLVAPLDGALAVMVLTIPENKRPLQPPAPGREDGEASLESLRRKLSQLTAAPEANVLGATGDMFVRMSQVDGGLALDLDARLPSGGPGELTAEVLRTFLQIGSLALSWLGPELPGELSRTVIAPKGDHLEASVVLSEASLMDAVQVAVDRQREITELTRRIEELVAQREATENE